MPLPLPLRWLLALVLILNGAVASPIMVQAADHPSQHNSQAEPAHCSGHDELRSPEAPKPHPEKCPCCTNGGACQCGCVVAALSLTFPDLRPLAPLTLIDQRGVPELATVPRHRLLRPPIV